MPPKTPYIFLTEAAADPKIVEAMMMNLINAFEEFLQDYLNNKVTYRDTLMGVHNFHVAMVLDLMARSASEGHPETMWIDAATSTFQERIDKEKTKRKPQQWLIT